MSGAVGPLYFSHDGKAKNMAEHREDSSGKKFA